MKFSIETAMDKDSKFVFRGELSRKIDRVEIVDDHTVMVCLKAAYLAFMDRASKVVMMTPKHYVEKVGDVEFANKPMGAGPFEFTDMKQDVYMRVTAKENHYRKAPFIKQVEVNYVQEATTRLAMAQAGEADIAMISGEHVETVQKDPNIRIVWSKHGYMRTLLFFALANPNEPSPILDKRVRKAIAYSIDTESITKLFHGMAEPWGNIIAPYHAGYDPDLKPHPYDPEKAKKLLAEAGYPNGVELVMNNTITYRLDSQAIQASLAKSGIKVKLELIEHGIWRKMLRSKKLKCMGVHPTPFGVSKRIKYWENPPGRVYPVNLEHLTLN